MAAKVYIHHDGYYSSPFTRHGTDFANFNAIELSASTGKEFVKNKKIDFTVYGSSVHQPHGFWAAPWFSHMLGLNCPSTYVSQACSTGIMSLFLAYSFISNNLYDNVYCCTADRTSNGPVTKWKNTEIEEDWIKDNFDYDPASKKSTLETAEAIAADYKITKEALDDITLYRHYQYAQKENTPYILQTAETIKDVGVRQITSDRLSKFKPIKNNGFHSLANITYAADGHTGIYVSNQKSDIPIEIISFGFGKTALGKMPAASLISTKKALDAASIDISKIDIINQHNAFAVNDCMFAKEFNVDIYSMNNLGSPLVYGHPQAPVLSRLLIEGIYEATQKGGGLVLVTGAAAGDQGATIICKVG